MCPANCISCYYNSTQLLCQSCATFYEPDATKQNCICILGLYMVSGQCLPNCPVKTFGDEPNRVCVNCPQ